jgi:hypothetical protein
MDDGTCTVEELVGMLAPTAGQERAQELVRHAVQLIGVSGNAMTLADGIRVLELLGRTPGVVGSVTRFAQARLRLREASSGAPASSKPSASVATLPPKEAPIGRALLTTLLAQSLGEEKSDELVGESLRKLGFPDDGLTLEQALATLEALTKMGELVGVAARFAKAHLYMRRNRS